jgi:hypothetical protein
MLRPPTLVLASAFVLLPVSSCSTPKADSAAPGKSTKGSSEAPGRVVGVKELPKEHKDLLAAYGKGGDTWEAARERALGDPALVRFLVENLTLEMVRAQRALGGTDPRRAQAAYDRARLELVRFGDSAVPSLVAFLEVSDAVGASEVSDVLERIGRPAVFPVAALLDSKQTETRRRAASLLARLPHSGSTREAEIRERLVELSEEDREWIVRAEVARALGGRGSRDSVLEPWRNALQAMLLDSDPAVVEAATKGLVQLGDERAVPRLIDLLDRTSRSGDLRAFQAAQAALVALTRQNEKASAEEWRRWWAEKRPKDRAGN